MKNKILAILLLLLLLLTCIPVSNTLAAGVTVTASVDSKTDITVPDGAMVTVEIYIENNTGADIVIEWIYCDYLAYDYTPHNVTIADGNGMYYFYDYTVNFGDDMEIHFPVQLRYSGDQPEYSNELNFFRETALGDPPTSVVKTLNDFSAAANKTRVKSGGEVEYTLYMKNQGNVEFTDYEFTLNGNAIKTYPSVMPGEEKTYVYKKSYTSSVTEVFNYGYTYQDGTKTHTVTGGANITFNITVEGSSGSSSGQDNASAGIKVTVSANPASIYKGGYTEILVTAENMTDEDFVDVGIKDQTGSTHGGWPMLEKKTVKSLTLALYPDSTTTYTFTVLATSMDGKDYSFDSNDVTITVNPAPPEQTEPLPTEEPTEEPQQPDPDTEEVKTRSGLSPAIIVIIAVILGLIAALIPLTVAAVRRKKKNQ